MREDHEDLADRTPRPPSKPSFQNGTWSGMGDLELGLGLKRYSHSENDAIWRFTVTKRANTVVISLDATVELLGDIKRWCERNMEMLRTDGGRIGDQKTAAKTVDEIIEEKFRR